MGDYVIRQGDCFASVAAKFGISVDELTGLGDNGRYREDGHSVHILRPGDVIEVPERPPARSTSFSSGGSKRYVVDVPCIMFRTRLIDRRNRAAADKRWRLVVMHREYEGRTDGGGWLSQDIPVAATEGALSIWFDDADKQPYQIPLLLGAMDPFDEDDGIANRLRSLGYASAYRGQAGFEEAVARFQRDEGLPITGDPDDATVDRLESRRTS